MALPYLSEGGRSNGLLAELLKQRLFIRAVEGLQVVPRDWPLPSELVPDDGEGLLTREWFVLLLELGKGLRSLIAHQVGPCR